jgi:putative transposase
LVGSLGRVGAAGDNAAMEPFFSLLQRKVLDHRGWKTREELRIAVVTWVETLTTAAVAVALGRLTPAKDELNMTITFTQVA